VTSEQVLVGVQFQSFSGRKHK